MSFMKPVMAIAAICATMLTMRVMAMRSRKNADMRKRRGLRRAR